MVANTRSSNQLGIRCRANAMAHYYLLAWE